MFYESKTDLLAAINHFWKAREGMPERYVCEKLKEDFSYKPPLRTGEKEIQINILILFFYLFQINLNIPHKAEPGLQAVFLT